MSLPKKFAQEAVILTFDFTRLVNAMGLADVDLISPLVTLNSVSGGNPLNNLRQQVYGLRLVVLVDGGDVGGIYEPAALATFSNGERRMLKDQMQVV